MVTLQSDKVDTVSIQQFLKKLRAKNKEKESFHVIWDNAGYHRSKDVQAYAANIDIKLHYLPPCSLNLNPIERLWKIMHEEISYNRYYKKFSDFSDATTNFFTCIARRKKLLRKRITDKFQIVGEPNFAF